MSLKSITNSEASLSIKQWRTLAHAPTQGFKHSRKFKQSSLHDRMQQSGDKGERLQGLLYWNVAATKKRKFVKESLAAMDKKHSLSYVSKENNETRGKKFSSVADRSENDPIRSLSSAYNLKKLHREDLSFVEIEPGKERFLSKASSKDLFKDSLLPSLSKTNQLNKIQKSKLDKFGQTESTQEVEAQMPIKKQLRETEKKENKRGLLQVLYKNKVQRNQLYKIRSQTKAEMRPIFNEHLQQPSTNKKPQINANLTKTQVCIKMRLQYKEVDSNRSRSQQTSRRASPRGQKIDTNSLSRTGLEVKIDQAQFQSGLGLDISDIEKEVVKNQSSFLEQEQKNLLMQINFTKQKIYIKKAWRKLPVDFMKQNP